MDKDIGLFKGILLKNWILHCPQAEPNITVPDRRSRILEVVIVRRLITWVLGIWRGECWGKGWERGGQFTSNLRPKWTDPVTARRVPSK